MNSEVKKSLQNAINYVRNDAAMAVGTLAVQHYKAAFMKGGLAGNKWKPRKMPRTGSTNNQGVLVASSHLMNSIDYRTEGFSAIIYSDLLYAQIHNEGGIINVTPKMKKFFWAKSYEMKKAGNAELANLYRYCALAKTITIPQRRFIGPDPELDNKIEQKITHDLGAILSGLN